MGDRGVVLLSFALQWGYFVFFEAIWDGQTPGKHWLGIRVVQDGGYSVSFGASASRNLVRFVDMQPALLYGVGLVSVVISKSGKRLGDIVAGTLVVREQRALVSTAVRSRAGSRDEVRDHLAPHRERVRAARRDSSPGARSSSRGCAIPSQRRWHAYRDHLDRRESAVQWRSCFACSRRRAMRVRADCQSPGAIGAARERHAIVALNAGRWRDFSAALEAAQRKGLARDVAGGDQHVRLALS